MQARSQDFPMRGGCDEGFLAQDNRVNEAVAGRQSPPPCIENACGFGPQVRVFCVLLCPDPQGWVSMSPCDLPRLSIHRFGF